MDRIQGNFEMEWIRNILLNIFTSRSAVEGIGTRKSLECNSNSFLKYENLLRILLSVSLL